MITVWGCSGFSLTSRVGTTNTLIYLILQPDEISLIALPPTHSGSACVRIETGPGCCMQMSMCRKRALPHRKGIFINRKCILLPDLLLCPVLV